MPRLLDIDRGIVNDLPRGNNALQAENSTGESDYDSKIHSYTALRLVVKAQFCATVGEVMFLVFGWRGAFPSGDRNFSAALGITSRELFKECALTTLRISM